MDAQRLLRAGAIVVASFLLSLALPANAALFRAYLSSTGKDSNPCTVVAPCRLLPAALAAVGDGGEIWMLDSANYNTSTVTIGKSVTILAIPGAIGSIVATSFDALDINGAGIKVALRNLFIVPLGSSGKGIFLQSGAELDVEDCRVTGMAGDGIFARALGGAAVVRIKNTILRDNGTSGFTASGTVIAMLDGVQISGSETGVVALDQSQINVTNSVLANNFVGASSFADLTGPTQLVVSHSTITGNSFGLTVGAGAGQDASLVTDANVISFVDQTVFKFSEGGGTETIHSRGNNTAGYYNIFITPGHLLTALSMV